MNNGLSCCDRQHDLHWVPHEDWMCKKGGVDGGWVRVGRDGGRVPPFLADPNNIVEVLSPPSGSPSFCLCPHYLICKVRLAPAENGHTAATADVAGVFPWPGPPHTQCSPRTARRPASRPRTSFSKVSSLTIAFWGLNSKCAEEEAVEGGGGVGVQIQPCSGRATSPPSGGLRYWAELSRVHRPPWQGLTHASDAIRGAESNSNSLVRAPTRPCSLALSRGGAVGAEQTATPLRQLLIFPPPCATPKGVDVLKRFSGVQNSAVGTIHMVASIKIKKELQYK